MVYSMGVSLEFVSARADGGGSNGLWRRENICLLHTHKTNWLESDERGLERFRGSLRGGPGDLFARFKPVSGGQVPLGRSRGAGGGR